MKRVQSLLVGLSGLVLMASLGCAQAELCGMAGSDGSISGTGFAGYWRTTFGIMRLVRFGANSIEGPSTASGYLKGTEMGTVFEGRLVEDTGAYHPATVTIHTTHDGRCMTGSYVFDGDKEVNEIIGYRMRKPSSPYTEYYELTERTEAIKRLIGGMLNLNDIDGPDLRAAIQGVSIPQPVLPQIMPTMPVSSDDQSDDDPESHEDNHERPEGYR